MTEQEVKAKCSDEWDDWYDDQLENAPFESCPKCGKDYDDIDFDFQWCNHCSWDAELRKYSDQ